MITPATCPPRVAIAIVSASQTSEALQCSAIAKPMSRLEYKSITVATYSLPSQVAISVMSPHHVTFRAGGLKSRRIRFSNFGAAGSGLVNDRRRRRFLATRPCAAMRSATVLTLKAAHSGRSTSSACTRGEPYSPSLAANTSTIARSSASRRSTVAVGGRPRCL
jgi:hypothetical protein